jgi:hypothetical protein
MRSAWTLSGALIEARSGCPMGSPTLWPCTVSRRALRLNRLGCRLPLRYQLNRVRLSMRRHGYDETFLDARLTTAADAFLVGSVISLKWNAAVHEINTGTSHLNLFRDRRTSSFIVRRSAALCSYRRLVQATETPEERNVDRLRWRETDAVSQNDPRPAACKSQCGARHANHSQAD